MLSVSAIIKNILTNKSTNFKSPTGSKAKFFVENGRIIDEDDQIIVCVVCGFKAPNSISFEEYSNLHEKFNFIVGQKFCGLDNKKSQEKNKLNDIMSAQRHFIKLVKLDDTIRTRQH
ncbi:ac56 [Sucra jujuba nucleopolyhedrovirus]|uniref:Ac56 n=1 Tax=Sucra jujuba nucleopolyhedrovirus TaxID=1563660 RepID=A0A097P8X6_9ABAC|nr:ac56 [Sucra jujuba nucleopolyhedrovirus]AIU41282.1 ac56 [Sucra jujuba nucleopolyhedrovirus]